MTAVDEPVRPPTERNPRRTVGKEGRKRTYMDLLCLDGVRRDDPARGGRGREGPRRRGAESLGEGFSEHGVEVAGDDEESGEGV